MTATTKSRSSPNPTNHRTRRNDLAILAALTTCVGGGPFVGGLLRGVLGPSRRGLQLQLQLARSPGGAHAVFASAAPLAPSPARPPSSRDASTASSSIATAAVDSEDMAPESCATNRRFFETARPDDDDPSLWFYHVEETTSAMDEARKIVENDLGDDSYDGTLPAAFVVSATSQTKGRGTSQRSWDSSRRGQALFTICIPQTSWTDNLSSNNGGRRVPLTLLPLKVGSVVAFHVQRALEECTAKHGKAQQIPKVTVKWPNDVLLRSTPSDPPSASAETHEKISGILIESARDWFLIGVGINVGYAPSIPREGADYGRAATCLSRYCAAEAGGDDEGAAEEHWIAAARALARNIARDFHAWLRPSPSSPPSPALYSATAILDEWKAYLDWDMALVLRDVPGREKVTLDSVLEDGRAVVREAATGRTRTLVADYFV